MLPRLSSIILGMRTGNQTEEEKPRIVKLATKIISADIKDIPAYMAAYPDEDC